MKNKFISPLLLLCCLYFSPALADNRYNYVDPALISPEFISPPLLKDSDLQKQEIDYILQRQREASAADYAAAAAEEKVRPEMMATDAVLLNRDNYPQTFVLLEKVGNDCHASVSNFKSYWNFPRPYMVDKRIKSEQFPGNSSYPSGHTACSRVWAEVLGQVTPGQRADFRARARQIADHRIIAGVHYPHDLMGGEQLALIFFGVLQASEKYQKDLAAAKAEWAK